VTADPAEDAEQAMVKKMSDPTPMMKQYLEIKNDYPDTILFFRIGDFYEMFYNDAKTASRVLDLVLTGKDCGLESRAPMCGIPFHAADSYIARLVSHGYKVAVCEQTEDPATAKGLVRREVIRVVTPGTVIESSMLDETRNNYLAVIYISDGRAGVCFGDVSTGQVYLTVLPDDDGYAAAETEIAKFSPSEIVMNAQSRSEKRIDALIRMNEDLHIEVPDENFFDADKALSAVEEHFGKDCDAKDTVQGMIALGALLMYLRSVQKNELTNIRNVEIYSDNASMSLDSAARRNLELTETLRSREKRGTLLWVLDKTDTAMGKRLLRSWLEQPLTDPAAISRRHNAVTVLISDTQGRSGIKSILSDIRDMERLITRISYKTANARELRTLCDTISHLQTLKDAVSPGSSRLLSDIVSGIDTMPDIYSLIDSSISDDPPFSVREGGLIKDGYNEQVDSLRAIVTDAQGYISGIETAEAQSTGIKKLKIGYNRVFGYYIEVPNGSKDLVPETYIRKQTLANCERYITEQLKDTESKVLGAQSRIVSLEYDVFCEVRDKTAQALARIQNTSHMIAELDVLCSFAECAVQYDYVCPEMTQESVIDIKNGRHPVVERMTTDSPFVPNDTYLDSDDDEAMLITGPNMAGKSTYMRQVALIVIMAQTGSFVPASSARLGITKSIFTRVGASDDLAAGRSTFMVEMNEVAEILKNAGKDSLIILDEIGRGTSTFDGMAIAKAVLEYVTEKTHAKTLFATHYHELCDAEGQMHGVKNYNIACKKRGDDIIFLRRIVRGKADGSYGVEVAKLAGVPSAVVKRAGEILRELETENRGIIRTPEDDTSTLFEDDEFQTQVSFSSNVKDEIADTLRNLDINTLTPIESMQVLYDLVKKAGGA
jgi:DNA mismatch repair protein MutS